MLNKIINPTFMGFRAPDEATTYIQIIDHIIIIILQSNVITVYSRPNTRAQHRSSSAELTARVQHGKNAVDLQSVGQWFSNYFACW